MGNLTRNIELRYLPSGQAVATASIAINRRYKKQDGSQGEEVCFVDVKLFGRTAEVANQYLKSGSSVLFEGRLALDSWVNANGQRQSKHSIIAETMQLGPRSQNNANYDNQQGDGMVETYQDYEPQQQVKQSKQSQKRTPQPHQPQREENIPVIDINEDDVPF